MSALQTYQHKFKGTALTTIIYKGQPCWLAGELGAILGYEPSRFADKMAGEWSGELARGQDFDLVEGEDLRELKQATAAVGSRGVGSRARSVTVLYETGLYLALMRTQKPVGKALRQFLSKEVLPQVTRDGQYSPDRAVVAGELVGKRENPANVLSWLYEELGAKEHSPLELQVLVAVANARMSGQLRARLARARAILREGNSTPEAPRVRDLRPHILEALRDGQPRTRRQLRSEIGARMDTMQHALHQLIADGQLEETESGVRLMNRGS